MSAGLDYHRRLPRLVQAPPGPQKRHDLCGEYGHPGVTYNPWMDRTWCLCGQVIRDGDVATHAACCGGPLSGEPL